MTFNTAYPKKRVRHQITFDKAEMQTKQSHRDECDVNQIVSRFEATGVIQHLNNHQRNYGDIDGTDFKEAMDLVADAKTMFEELPSDIRTRFKNDPSRFLDFMANPKNESEMIELGLATKIEPAEKIPIDVKIVETDKKPNVKEKIED